MVTQVLPPLDLVPSAPGATEPGIPGPPGPAGPPGPPGNSSGGAEFLIATPGSTQISPIGDLSLSVQVSVLVNTTSADAFWHLPDGTEGLIKEIVSGAPGNLSNAFIGITSTNNWSNDLLDLNINSSVRLVWITAAGGWVVISNCTTVNNFWD